MQDQYNKLKMTVQELVFPEAAPFTPHVPTNKTAYDEFISFCNKNHAKIYESLEMKNARAIFLDGSIIEITIKEV